jgi:hypothetical protein
MIKLRIAPEFGCYPIWISNGNLSVPESIPSTELHVSNELSELINKWDSLFQSTYNDDYPPDSGFLSEELCNLYFELSEDVYRKLIQELGNIYQFVFIGISKDNSSIINERVMKILSSCLDMGNYETLYYVGDNSENKTFRIQKPKNTYLSISKKLLNLSVKDFTEYLLINEIEIEDNIDKNPGMIIQIDEGRIIKSI